MAFRKDKTTAAQTSANVAGSVTSTRISTGELQGDDAINGALVATYKALFAELGPVVEGDNQVFEAAEASSPASSGGGSGGGRRTTPSNPGDVEFFGGKFKGMTIAQVYGLSEADAKAKGSFSDGASYIADYAATEKNTNETTRTAAKAFLATLQEA